MQSSSVEHMTSRNKEAEIWPMQVHHHFDASLAKAKRRAELDECIWARRCLLRPGDGHLVEVIRAACVHGHRRCGGAHTAGGAKAS